MHVDGWWRDVGRGLRVISAPDEPGRGPWSARERGFEPAFMADEAGCQPVGTGGCNCYSSTRPPGFERRPSFAQSGLAEHLHS